VNRGVVEGARKARTQAEFKQLRAIVSFRTGEINPHARASIVFLISHDAAHSYTSEGIPTFNLLSQQKMDCLRVS